MAAHFKNFFLIVHIFKVNFYFRNFLYFSVLFSDLHCHTDREGGIDKKARNKLIIASVLCLAFMILEIGKFLVLINVMP